ncbi:hypothetical protein [Novosphingobium sp.]|uniref:hypothetical protein n=1 Tax=Novosphingobium sp. TaxID=1874826 RepID=UPI0031DBB76D
MTEYPRDPHAGGLPVAVAMVPGQPSKTRHDHPWFILIALIGLGLNYFVREVKNGGRSGQSFRKVILGIHRVAEN